MKPSEAIHLLKELNKEHKDFWKAMKDTTSPRIIDEVIKFIRAVKS